ncbi:VOC family protein [Phenylobacterium montanum]|uniref:VOC family protein n=1 Tax=Phenylobacterium montanum TaxID=2823693 RepID=A0A975FV31_9CAUL|nr:glyoxalase superfamily protein [Caulobacter sp. S6]QUD86023.1 VOC family protein [Caulobacter sp. S6]
MPGWYSRPVLAVRHTPLALEFYKEKLGFQEDWRHEEEGRLRIVQVSRAGCELILSDQWPEDAGWGRIFISLDAEDFDFLVADLLARGVRLQAGYWGYDLTVVKDPDGNSLWFPHPSSPIKG